MQESPLDLLLKEETLTDVVAEEEKYRLEISEKFSFPRQEKEFVEEMKRRFKTGEYEEDELYMQWASSYSALLDWRENGKFNNTKQ